MGRFCIRKRRKLAEHVALIRSMHPLSVRIKHNQDAPLVRERHSADHWRGRRQWSASTVDDETSAVEQADADSRACAATEPDGIASHIQGQSVEPAHARRDGQC